MAAEIAATVTDVNLRDDAEKLLQPAERAPSCLCARIAVLVLPKRVCKALLYTNHMQDYYMAFKTKAKYSWMQSPQGSLASFPTPSPSPSR